MPIDLVSLPLLLEHKHLFVSDLKLTALYLILLLSNNHVLRGKILLTLLAHLDFHFEVINFTSLDKISPLNFLSRLFNLLLVSLLFVRKILDSVFNGDLFLLSEFYSFSWRNSRNLLRVTVIVLGFNGGSEGSGPTLGRVRVAHGRYPHSLARVDACVVNTVKFLVDGKRQCGEVSVGFHDAAFFWRAARPSRVG